MELTLTMPSRFPTLGARVLYGPCAYYPAFVPQPGDASPESQREMHDFLRGILRKCYEQPELIGIAPVPDDSFSKHWALNNSNPKLVDAISALEKKQTAFIDLLRKMGSLGQIDGDALVIASADWRIAAKTIAQLAEFGLTAEKRSDGWAFRCPEYPNIFPGWKQRAAIPEGRWGKLEHTYRFLFNADDEAPYTPVQIFGKIPTQRHALERVDSFFEARGYKPENGVRAFRAGLEGFYPDKEKAFVRVEYRPRDLYPLSYTFRVPGYRRLLDHYEEMPKDVKQLVFNRTNACSGCGYCKKTGKGTLLALNLSLDGETKLKCPHWPYLVWHEPDDEVLDTAFALYAFAEETLYGKTPFTL